jgi:transcription antitermination factor NusG
MRTDADLDWYPLIAAPQKEFKAEADINSRGLTAFVPREVKMRRVSPHSKKRKAVEYPLMMRYVFVGVEKGTMPWHDLRQIDTIVGAVRFNGAPVRIRPSEIEALRKHNGQVVPYIASVSTHRAFQVGEVAVVAEGALKGSSVTVDGVSGETATITLEMLGSQRQTTVPLEMLEPVE